jgi:isochorismate hydrolase
MLVAEDSFLVVVDVQGKLAEVMHNRDDMFGNIARLTQAAAPLQVSMLVTEQLPDKLGPTRAEVSAALKEIPVVAKSSFSCAGEPAFMAALKASGKRQIVLCGIEAHICVLQTALQLLEEGYAVFVVADAVSSRDPENRRLALERMRQHGADIIVTESALFEWIRDAAHPAFREVRKVLA